MKLRRVWVLVLCACFATPRRSIKDDWPSYNGDYTGRRFSSLTQITPQNAANLQAQWVFHTKTPGVLEATPVVVNGIMYVTARTMPSRSMRKPEKSVALCAADLERAHRRRFRSHQSRCGHLGTRLYMETDNAHLLCLDADPAT